MSILDIEQKRRLSALLKEGHRKFGPVSPRRPYKEDDDEGGEGGGIKVHPLLAEQPVGASSDLTSIASENIDALDNAEARKDQHSKELKKQLDNKKELGKSLQNKNAPKPSPLG